MHTYIQWPPLLSVHGQLLAVPRVILFCVIPLRRSQLSCFPEWLLFRGLTVIYRKKQWTLLLCYIHL